MTAAYVAILLAMVAVMFGTEIVLRFAQDVVASEERFLMGTVVFSGMEKQPRVEVRSDLTGTNINVFNSPHQTTNLGAYPTVIPQNDRERTWSNIVDRARKSSVLLEFPGKPYRS